MVGHVPMTQGFERPCQRRQHTQAPRPGHLSMRHSRKHQRSCSLLSRSRAVAPIRCGVSTAFPSTTCFSSAQPLRCLLKMGECWSFNRAAGAKGYPSGRWEWKKRTNRSAHIAFRGPWNPLRWKELTMQAHPDPGHGRRAGICQSVASHS